MKKLLTMAVCLAFLSCSQREEQKIKLSNEEVSKMINLSGKIKNLNREGPQTGQVNIGIFEVTLHRASRECKSGFGFCDFEWFPSPTPTPPPPPPIVVPKNEKVEVQVKETKGNYYFNLFALEKVNSNVSISDLDIIVDEDITANFVDGETHSLTIEKGNYSFDATIGEYGGYYVKLKKN